MNTFIFIAIISLCIIILTSIIGYAMYLKYKYLFIKDKEKRTLTKEFYNKFDEFTKSKLSKDDFLTWLMEVYYKDSKKINRRLKLEKIETQKQS